MYAHAGIAYSIPSLHTVKRVNPFYQPLYSIVVAAVVIAIVTVVVVVVARLKWRRCEMKIKGAHMQMIFR